MDDEQEQEQEQEQERMPVKFEWPDALNGELLLWRDPELVDGKWAKFRYGFYITSDGHEIEKLRAHDPRQADPALTPFVYEVEMDSSSLTHSPTPVIPISPQQEV